MKFFRTFKILMIGVALHIPALVFSQAPDSTNIPLRKWKRFAVTGELGVNSLASIKGLAGSYYFKRDMAFDLGFGMSEYGLRPGIRYRYLFSPEKFSTFAGVGFNYSPGNRETFEPVFGFTDTGGERLRLKSAAFLDLCTGLDYQAYNGILILCALGWSFHLGPRSYEAAPYETGALNYKADDLAFGSGPLISLALGYAFGTK